MAEGDKMDDQLWLQNLQLELDGAFTWAYDEADDTFCINGDRYTINSILGEGSFGAVYRCTCESMEGGGAQEVAVKIISTDRAAIVTGCDKQSILRSLLHEVEMLGRLGGHPHIVQLHSAAISPTNLRIFIVMPLLRCSDLFKELLQRRKPFPEEEARQIVKQLAMAVSHCHRNQISHRDLRLENVMLARRHPPVVKLVDFGQAQLQHVETAAPSLSCLSTKTPTSSLYTPPEVKHAGRDGVASDAFKIDAFGFGVICYALLCNSLPQVGEGKGFEKSQAWNRLSANAQDVITRLLCPDPDDRISIAEALQHPFMTSIGPASLSSCASSQNDVDHELQALMVSHALVQALQRERGASCWKLDGSQDAGERCRWMAEATNDQFHEAIAAVENLQCKETAELGTMLRSIRSGTEAIRKVCGESSEQGGRCSFDTFDNIFATYCKLNEQVIQFIGRLLVTIQKPNAALTVAEIRIRFLLLVAEQLGRERAFICGHLPQRDVLMSWPVQKRFAKIQGCRQFLLGSMSPTSAESGVVSFEFGLLPSLRLVDVPLISKDDLKVLEDAENSVHYGRTTTSEWFAIITELINKIHRQASMAFVDFVELTREISHHGTTSKEGATPPSQTEPPGLTRRMGHEANMQHTSSLLSTTSNEDATPLSQKTVAESPCASFSLSDMASSDVATDLPRTNSRQGMRSTAVSKYYGRHGRKCDSDGSNESVQHQESLDSTTILPSSSGGFGSSGDELPMKVLPSQFGGPVVCTPETTPLHPGLYRAWCQSMLQPAQPASSPSAVRLPPPTFLAQGYPPQTLLAQDPVQEQGISDAQTFSAPLPELDTKNTFEETNPKALIISRGTIGHPISCRGLGCKFASKDRGCKEGIDCTRCHLCVWKREAERREQRMQL